VGPSGWNDTVTAYERNSGIDRVFRDRADQWPEDLAVIDGASSVNYRALDALASRVAGRQAPHAGRRLWSKAPCVDDSPQFSPQNATAGVRPRHSAVTRPGANECEAAEIGTWVVRPLSRSYPCNTESGTRGWQRLHGDREVGDYRVRPDPLAPFPGDGQR
jgi:hypothetical protein